MDNLISKMGFFGRWIAAVLMLLFAGIYGVSQAGMMFLTGAIIVCPLLDKWYIKRGKKPRKAARAILCVWGFILGCISIPDIDTKSDSNNVAQVTQETVAVAEETEPEEAEPVKTPIIVTSDDLFAALEENALKASVTYKDQYIEVKGKVSNIDSSGDYFSIGSLTDDFSFDTILCNISEEHLDAVMNFSGDQEVTVVGTITEVGEVLGYSIEVETIK